MGKKTKVYGNTPWGQSLLSHMKSMGGRIERGEALARTNKVYDTEIQERTISAKVVGRSADFYNVSATFPELNDQQRKEVLTCLRQDSALLADVLVGNLPERLLAASQERGVPILPTSFQELNGQCECPDNRGETPKFWRATAKKEGEPCKHQAALYFQLVDEVDKNPHTLLALRGVNLHDTLHVTTSSALQYPLPITRFSETRHASEKPVAASEPAFAVPKNSATLVTQCLSPSPLFSSLDYREVLVEFYSALRNRARLAEKWSEEHPWTSAFDAENARRILHRAEYTLILPRTFVTSQARVLIVSDVWSAQHNIESRIDPGETLGPAPFKPAPRVDGGVYVTLSTFLQILALTSAPGSAGSASFRFFFYMSRALQLTFTSANFVPAVLPLDDQRSGSQWRVLYRPLMVDPCVEIALRALDEIAEHASFVQLLESREIVVPICGRSATLHALSAALNVLILTMEFKHKNWGRRSPPKESLTFFRNEPYTALSLQEQSNGAVVDRWLKSFDLLSIGVDLRIVLEEQEQHQKFSMRLDSRSRSDSVSWHPIPEFLSKCDAGEMSDALRFVMSLKPHIPKVETLLKAPGTATLSLEEFENFIIGRSGLLRALGVHVILPKGVQSVFKPRLVTRATEIQANRNVVTYLDMGGLLQFEKMVAIGDQLVSVAEFEEMVSAGRRLFRFKEMYVEMSPEEVESILASKSETQLDLSPMDVIREHLIQNQSTVFTEGAKVLIERILTTDDVPLPPHLKATLRAYQIRGFHWLYSTALKVGGALLADDMGLGKTVQTIALLLSMKAKRILSPDEPAVVVAPTSLGTNWVREIGKFSPTLQTVLYLSLSRASGKKKRLKMSNSADVIVASYANVRIELNKLKAFSPSVVVLDEAQNIKNETSQISAACKALAAKAKVRVALTGTPVENKLLELHNIFDFCLPGFLGTSREFVDRFSKPIERDRDADALGTLKRMTGPFMLRRVKTDKSIISDLPPKTENDVLVRLTPTQAALYESVVNEVMIQIDEAKELKLPNPGLVFKLLSALKQICDHPACYSREQDKDFSLSGKATALMELLEPIIESGEKVLVFTQFVGMGHLLESQILRRFHVCPLFFHGSLNQRQRDAVTREFDSNQAKQILILSLKAGGVGLNLTAASHVIHFDRWYNPSVENQATDRCFRIGQEKHVFVHRIICSGTFEERISEMISQKKELNSLSVTVGENWISKLSSAELENLFSLSTQSVQEGE